MEGTFKPTQTFSELNLMGFRLVVLLSLSVVLLIAWT